MARDGNGLYSLPANTLAVSGDTIDSTKFNTLVQDVEADLNVDRPVAAGGTGASSASGARTNLGITGNLFDVTASAFALTILDDANAAAVRTTIGAGTGSGDMLKSENLSGLANAGTARSNLGLGTAATQNTGTSGATIPLLNAANTFGATQTFNANTYINGAAGTDRQLLYTSAGVLRWSVATTSGAETGSNAGSEFAIARFNDAGSFLDLSFSINRASGVSNFVTTPTAGGSTIWHAGNDGAGSGLDADTLDGVQASAFAQIGSVNVFTTTQTVQNTNARFNVRRPSATENFQVAVDAGSILVQSTTNHDLVFRANSVEFGRGTPAGTFHSRVSASAATSGTLTAASANRTIQATGNITIANSVFAAGDIILIYAGASARTITQGAGVTMRLDGTATTGSRTLAARGIAVLFFVSASQVIVAGGAVT